MNKLISFFIFQLLFVHFSFAQKELKQKKNIIYLQAGGPSIVASLNYERILFSKNRLSMNGRFGTGTNRFKDFTNSVNPDLTFPLGLALNFTIKQMKKGQFNAKFSLGNTFASIVMASSDFSPIRQNTQNGYTSIDAIWQNDRGLYLGLGYSAIFVQYQSLNHWGQLSLGITF